IDANGKKLTEEDGTNGTDGTDVRYLLGLWLRRSQGLGAFGMVWDYLGSFGVFGFFRDKREYGGGGAAPGSARGRRWRMAEQGSAFADCQGIRLDQGKSNRS